VLDSTAAFDNDSATSGPWEEFVRWARRFYEDPEFDATERDYKLKLGELVAHAREALETGVDWLGALKSALKSRENNITRFNQRDALLNWADANRDDARRALAAIWGESAPIEERIAGFCDVFPKDALPGQGMRATLVSVLLLAQDPTNNPPYKPDHFNDAYRLTAYPPLKASNEAAEYAYGLKFLDRVLNECAQHGLKLRDRLDAQAVVWSVLKNDLPSPNSDAERKAFEAFRGAGGVWWVNQGSTYAAERAGGYVWAPQRAKNGAVFAHHANVARLKKGDIVLHYANGTIRAISRVSRRATEADRPKALPGDVWATEGYLAHCQYFDLGEPIKLDELPIGLREQEPFAFNKHGGVNQGYLFPVTESFAIRLRSEFAERWPAAFHWADTEVSHWLFQANPRIYDLASHLPELPPTSKTDWTVTRLRDQMRPHDHVILWQGGAMAGIYAVAMIAGSAFVREPGDGFLPSHENREEWAIPLEIIAHVDPPILKRALLAHPVLKDLSVMRTSQGTNFKVTPDQWEALEILLDSNSRPATAPGISSSLADICTAFADALKAAHLDYGTCHQDLVRSFVVSLATKRFLLLTGLSGSGKTRLAIAFGQWLGNGRLKVVAVRPDWTGPDALLGYENGLSEAVMGRLAWQVPEALEFMLQAASHPGHPYLLLLDEMNLAHVERYFADVLSGMESGADVLPNLRRGDDGSWRIADPESPRLAFPPNLLVVGTVNIDETTYMFSPKVLDRANTIEFRVATADLVAHERPPAAVDPGSDELVAAFHAAATSTGVDGEWTGRMQMERYLRDLHTLLAKEDREFGHRVYFEALRFGSLLTQAGVADPLTALDLQVMQRVLPRLHGSIRQVGESLARLGAWCYFGPEGDLPTEFDPATPPEHAPALPVSFDKIQRMTRRLRANHFVSFAE
jgi:hypothetical protein